MDLNEKFARINRINVPFFPMVFSWNHWDFRDSIYFRMTHLWHLSGQAVCRRLRAACRNCGRIFESGSSVNGAQISWFWQLREYAYSIFQFIIKTFIRNSYETIVNIQWCSTVEASSIPDCGFEIFWVIHDADQANGHLPDIESPWYEYPIHGVFVNWASSNGCWMVYFHEQTEQTDNLAGL